MLSGKNAVVTGASRGIGRAIALKLASQGADVALVYAGNQAAAESVAAEIASMGRKAVAYQCDVADFSACKKTVMAVIKEFGGVDILVNNAGITRDKLVAMMKEDDFDAVVNTNLKGTFNMIKSCYANFLKRKAGRIINISSVSGIMGNAGQANYSASKAGIIGLTKSVARELAPRGVTCNAIAPGYVATDMTAELGGEDKSALLATIPLARLGSPEDIACTAVFLASEGAAYITGEVIRVDGGMAM